MEEVVVSAALAIHVGEDWRAQEWNGKKVYPNCLIISSPPPARHHSLMHPLSDHGIRIGPDQQGFLTSKGRFVSRKEAMGIAIKSNQPRVSETLNPDADLFSEDLW